MQPKFFPTPLSLKKWFQKNSATATELIIGFYKVSSGKKSITWSQAVDEALCVGWIDGVRTSINEEAYKIRFTKRRPGSIWSAVNIKKMEELTAANRMQPAGLQSFQNRIEGKSGIYSYEADAQTLHPDFVKQFKKNKKAWAYFDALAPSYKKVSWHWVSSAKQEVTQQKRLAQLIAESEAGTNQWKDNKYTKKTK